MVDSGQTLQNGFQRAGARQFDRISGLAEVYECFDVLAYQYEQLEEKRSKQSKHLADALVLLRELEWGKCRNCRDYCPICGCCCMPHRPDCKLDALIRAIAKALKEVSDADNS